MLVVVVLLLVAELLDEIIRASVKFATMKILAPVIFKLLGPAPNVERNMNSC